MSTYCVGIRRMQVLSADIHERGLGSLDKYGQGCVIFVLAPTRSWISMKFKCYLFTTTYYPNSWLSSVGSERRKLCVGGRAQLHLSLYIHEGFVIISSVISGSSCESASSVTYSSSVNWNRIKWWLNDDADNVGLSTWAQPSGRNNIIVHAGILALLRWKV